MLGDLIEEVDENVYTSNERGLPKLITNIGKVNSTNANKAFNNTNNKHDKLNLSVDVHTNKNDSKLFDGINNQINKILNDDSIASKDDNSSDLQDANLSK